MLTGYTEATEPLLGPWSASVQPILSWYIDRLPSGGAFYLTLSDEDDGPMIENRRLTMPVASGLQRTALSDLGSELTPALEYRWSISSSVSSVYAWIACRMSGFERSP